jgi:23S rRNA pseudouridine1911/1915/1917 synthase
MKFKAERPVSLLEALQSLSPNSSKTTFKKWIQEGRCLVDGSPVKKLESSVPAGAVVELGSKVHFLQEGVKILYEDSDLVIVEKPSGLLSVATAFEMGDTLHAILKRHYKPRRVQVVHRLDQDTSGVMVFALSDSGYVGLKKLFEAHDIEREYLAIVEGAIRPETGSFKSYLYEDAAYKVHETHDSTKGRLAITHYQVLGTSSRYSRLKLNLETGRKNQIRVHCQQAGHPVVGDIKYGAHSNPIRRLALHAALLAFVHPVTKKKISFRSTTPEEFERLK